MENQGPLFFEAVVGIVGFENLLVGGKPTAKHFGIIATIWDRTRDALRHMLMGTGVDAAPYDVSMKRLLERVSDETIMLDVDDAYEADVLAITQNIRDFIRGKIKTRASGDLLQDLIAGDDLPENQEHALTSAALAADLLAFLDEIASGALDTVLVQDFAAMYPSIYGEIKTLGIEVLGSIKAKKPDYDPATRISQQFGILYQTRTISAPIDEAIAADAARPRQGSGIKLPSDASRAQELTK